MDARVLEKIRFSNRFLVNAIAFFRFDYHITANLNPDGIRD